MYHKIDLWKYAIHHEEQIRLAMKRMKQIQDTSWIMMRNMKTSLYMMKKKWRFHASSWRKNEDSKWRKNEDLTMPHEDKMKIPWYTMKKKWRFQRKKKWRINDKKINQDFQCVAGSISLKLRHRNLWSRENIHEYSIISYLIFLVHCVLLWIIPWNSTSYHPINLTSLGWLHANVHARMQPSSLDWNL